MNDRSERVASYQVMIRQCCYDSGNSCTVAHIPSQTQQVFQFQHKSYSKSSNPFKAGLKSSNKKLPGRIFTYLKEISGDLIRNKESSGRLIE